MSKKETEKKKPKVAKDLNGFEISIDTFGEISSNLQIDKINEFLNKNVDDKKLRDREDIEEIKKKTSKDED
ncbi:MAG: hypothetical protein RIF36_08580 [Imperialibacter sp.]|jgi:hypothetical protein|uniref:hypothetical protein n=1 Tax=Imperialibacter sp. TaxID=2038411 RepID=UPI0032EEBE30